MITNAEMSFQTVITGLAAFLLTSTTFPSTSKYGYDVTDVVEMSIWYVAYGW